MYLPSQCAICKAWPSHAICDACVAAFGRPALRCHKCAAESALKICTACLQNPPILNACWATLSYTWPWVSLIAQFKFQSQPGWARHFALLMQSTPYVADAIEQAHVLIPIPLSSKRLSERGFNQSLVLSQQLSLEKTHPSSLLRMRNTLAQSSLPRQQRLTNLQGAFAVAPFMAAKLRGQRILLIDDVMTSGATLNAAAQVLKQAGAMHVSALVFARTPA
ncbi:MAG: ComF family protein [Betaproteobacteria bacterium]|nr:ComF family protein [Betaproteobacteria bacterium]